MTNDTDPLIDALDPRRDYGERSYDDVVDDVRAGRLQLEPGRTLPVIRDAASRRSVKGTGQPPVPDDADLGRWGRKRFNVRAAEDFDAVYESVVECATSGDVRAQKLFVETYLGRPREAQRADDDRTLKLLLAMASQPRERTVVIEAE